MVATCIFFPSREDTLVVISRRDYFLAKPYSPTPDHALWTDQAKPRHRAPIVPATLGVSFFVQGVCLDEPHPGFKSDVGLCRCLWPCMHQLVLDPDSGLDSSYRASVTTCKPC